MIGISLLLLVVGWFWLGGILWWKLVLPRVHNALLKALLTFVLATIWFVGPVFDEILGAREFDQLCREMPENKFYGPAQVGPGVFFDAQGRRRWKNSDEFSAIIRNTDRWNQLFDKKDLGRENRKLPMPIRESHTLYFEKSTGNSVMEYFSLYSEGGWLRRLIGIGDYQCPGKYRRLIKEEEWITFKANN